MLSKAPELNGNYSTIADLNLPARMRRDRRGQVLDEHPSSGLRSRFMWLAVPSPSPSPISITVNVPSVPPPTILPDPILDHATIALAAFTAVLAMFTILLAFIGWRALRWQRREIQHTAEQLKLAAEQLELARDEFQTAQIASWPELQANVRFTHWQNVVVEAKVSYLHGSQPAYDAALVIRRTDMLCGGRVGTLAPYHREIERIFGTLPDHMHWPAEIQQAQLHDKDWQVALTWTRTDGKVAHMSWLVRNNNPDGPPDWVSGSRELRRRHPEPGPLNAVG